MAKVTKVTIPTLAVATLLCRESDLVTILALELATLHCGESDLSDHTDTGSGNFAVW